jgi:integrase
MAGQGTASAQVVPFPTSRKKAERSRKSGLNINKDGSVRNVNGKVYVDFIYLGERVRESSGLPWNEANRKRTREDLDKIVVKIKEGTFRFTEVFPKSKRVAFFENLEREVFRLKETPEQVSCKDFFARWYELLSESGRVTGRTLFGYRSYINLYLTPFFGEMTFADLNAINFDRFISWIRQQCLRGKEVSNATINKCFTVLKMICKSVAIEYGWGSSYSPFFGFKKLREDDPYEDIVPFSLDEQRTLIENLPDHWKPYFRFAFCAGLRPGEQVSIQPADIDWENGILHIRRAITRDENGKKVMGTTKNRFSRRAIRLIPVMLEALRAQQEVYDRFKGKYFFCTTTGVQIDTDNLRDRVWSPTLQRVGLTHREMKQTRHTFATVSLGCGENPLWIARTMGHRNTEMIIKVYTRYIERFRGSDDGGLLNRILEGDKGSGA